MEKQKKGQKGGKETMELPSKTILLKLYRDLVASRQVEA